jgi:tRNA threonylcarbamoyl adenosine modification protein YeaZ
MKRELILAIETGIGGGSLSLLRDDFEIDFWRGEAKISKSEDLLANISRLLSKNKLSKNDIKRIAVSIGPGSFTGVRIGIATAKGLQKAFGCELSGVSILEAMALKSKKSKKSKKNGAKIAAFMLNKTEVCWQKFETADTKTAPETASVGDFISMLETLRNTELILTGNLLENIGENKSDLENVSEFTGNFAKYVGLKSVEILSTVEIMPIYAR